MFCAVPEIFSSSEFCVAHRNEQDGEGREEDAGGLSCPNQLAEDLLGNFTGYFLIFVFDGFVQFACTESPMIWLVFIQVQQLYSDLWLHFITIFSTQQRKKHTKQDQQVNNGPTISCPKFQ